MSKNVAWLLFHNLKRVEPMLISSTQLYILKLVHTTFPV